MVDDRKPALEKKPEDELKIEIKPTQIRLIIGDSDFVVTGEYFEGVIRAIRYSATLKEGEILVHTVKPQKTWAPIGSNEWFRRILPPL